jgi:hypothetical protein
VLGILVWQEGGEAVGALLVIGAIALVALVYWLRRRKRQGKPTLLDPDLFKSQHFRLGITQQLLQQIALGGTMIALPIYLQMVLEDNALLAGLTIAPLSLDEIIRINTDTRPLALQVAPLVPILAGLVGLFNSFRLLRLPDITPSGSVEGMALG